MQRTLSSAIAQRASAHIAMRAHALRPLRAIRLASTASSSSSSSRAGSSRASRAESDALLSELSRLEQQLAYQRAQDATSFSTFAKTALRAHGPLLCAMLLGLGSMTAAFALWQGREQRAIEEAARKGEREKIKKRKTDVEMRRIQEERELNKRIKEFSEKKVAFVSIPSSSSAAQQMGWVDWVRGRSPAPAATEAATEANAAAPAQTGAAAALTTKRYSASKGELQQLQQLQQAIRDINNEHGAQPIAALSN